MLLITNIRLRSEPRQLTFSEGRIAFGLETWTNGDYSGLSRPTSYLEYQVSEKRFLESNLAIDGGKTVIDVMTGLMWQQSLSAAQLSHEAGRRYVCDINENSFAGYEDWRLPTIPELMSLLRPDFHCANGGQFIDVVFENGQWPGRSFWSVDRCGPDSAWHVNFAILDVGPLNVGQALCVRAVRSAVLPRSSGVEHACTECRGKGTLTRHYANCRSGFPAVDVFSGSSMSYGCSCEPTPMYIKCGQCDGTGMYFE